MRSEVGKPSASVEEKEQVVPMKPTRRNPIRESAVLPFVWIVVIIIFSILRPHTFATGSNVSSILGSQAVLVVVTLALVIVLHVGDYDLSVAANLGLAAVLAATLNVNDGLPIVAACAVAVVGAVLVGVVNGFFVVKMGIESLIVTLGMATLLEGVTLWVSGSLTISGVSQTLVNVVAVDSFLGIPLEFYFGVGITIVLWYVFSFTSLGQRMKFVGLNRDVSRLSGIRVGRVRWGALAGSGLLAGLAGILYLGTSGTANPTAGASLLLPAFAAAFLGSTTIKPGSFNALGTLVAVYFLMTGISGFAILGAGLYVQNIFYGSALILAVTLSKILHKPTSSV